MGYQQYTVPCAPGEWVQLCELRPTRKGLRIQLLSGGIILALRPEGLVNDGLLGQTPPGQYHTVTDEATQGYFDLSLERDGDMVIAAWHGWLIPGSGNGNQTTTFALPGLQTYTVPLGVTQLLVQCVGGGGGGAGGDPANQVSGPGGGGGGGAFASSVLTVVPGQTYTLQVGNAGDTAGATPTDPAPTTATPSWFSLTGTVPVSSADGVLAAAGQDGSFGLVPPNAASGVGGAGGSAAASIGTTTISGGNGGNGNPAASGNGTAGSAGFGTGGAGGGGASLNLAGTAGEDGNITGTDGNATLGGTVGGGNGAGGTGSAFVPPADGYAAGGGGGAGASYSDGTGNVGAIGFFGLVVVTPATPGVQLVNVVESWDVPSLDDPSWEPPGPTVSVTWPRLGSRVLRALTDLLARPDSGDTTVGE